jgi:hypothetical protein
MLSLVSPCHTGPLRFLPRTPVSIDTVLNGPTNLPVDALDDPRVVLAEGILFPDGDGYVDLDHDGDGTGEEN